MPKPSLPLPALIPEDILRFWSYIKKGEADECWPWGGHVGSAGYGKITIRGQTITVHRLALFLHSGVDPAPLFACHTCDYKLCCNGAHLFRGTPAQNSKDMAIKGRAASGERNGTHLYPERVARGERQGSAKLTTAEVKQIRRLAKQGHTYNVLAAAFHVGKSTIFRVVKRTHWAHV